MNLENFEYCFEAWNKYLQKDSRAIVLSDSSCEDITRFKAEDLSNRVRGWLRKHKVGTGDFVLINLERGVKPVLAIMGVWKNGSAFTLVEKGYAKERVNFIRKDWQPKIEINEDVWPEIMDTVPAEGFWMPDDHDAALAVYTSGTTGRPKGVLHEFGQIKLEMISEQRPDGSWRENEKTRWGLVAPLNFVASLKIVVHFLYCGGHLYILDYGTVKNPKKLSAYFFKNRINETFLSPSLIRLKGPDYGPFMQYIYTGAEPANFISVNKAELNNTYTMSESFFTVAEYIIDKAYDVCPIGTPMFDLPIKLLDEKGQEAAEGERGEFCFYNPYCRGYVNDPEANALHFFDGWCHTGDLAVFENGLYTLKGRRDDMIKIDGNRIEPSEIEAACRNVMGLSLCAAKGFENEAFVALYYTDDIDFEEDDIRQKLTEILPYYMIPAYFVKMDRLPLNASGKLDRKQLTMPKNFYKEIYVAPRDAFESKLAAAAEKILEIDKIGIKDDFFKLGGNSIKAMMLLSEMDDDEALTPAILYQGRTIEKIAVLYRQAKENALSIEEKEALGRQKSLPLSPSLLWYWENMNNGAIDFYQEIQLSFFVPAGLLTKRINAYMRHNSTFNMVLEPGENGIPVQKYIEDLPFVEVEYMSEAKVAELEKTFVRPFNYGEPLIRIKVIRTVLHTYLLFHAFHMVVDGDAMHFLIEDLLKAIKNEPVPDSAYFAFAFDENRWSQPENIEKHLSFFKETYFDQDYDICIRSDVNTGQKGAGVSRPAKIPLKLVQDYCESRKISVNQFLVAAVLLTQSAFNGTDRNMTIWNFSNRGPKDNHAGNIHRAVFSAIDRSKISSLKALYTVLDQQNEAMLWRLHDYDYFFEFDRAEKEPNLTITYLEDWFSHDTIPPVIGNFKTLPNTQETSPDSEIVYALCCTHEKGMLQAVLQYGRSFNTEESANRFIDMLEFAMNEITADRLPDFSNFEPGGK